MIDRQVSMFHLTTAGSTEIGPSQNWEGWVEYDPVRGVAWANTYGGMARIDGHLAVNDVVGDGWGLASDATVGEVRAMAAGGSRLVSADRRAETLTLWALDGTPLSSRWNIMGHFISGIALDATGRYVYFHNVDEGGMAEMDTATGTTRQLGFGINDLIVAVGPNLWNKASTDVRCLDRATGNTVHEWQTGLDSWDDEVSGFAVTTDGSAVAVIYKGELSHRVRVFTPAGVRTGDWALPGYLNPTQAVGCGTDQIAILASRDDALAGMGEVVGFSLTGQQLWRTAIPGGLPMSHWISLQERGWVLPEEPLACIAADPSGQHIYVADNDHGVIHHLQRQSVASSITEVMPCASVPMRAVTVHVWGNGLPTGATVALRQGTQTIALTDVISDGPAHLYGIADLRNAAEGWWDLVVAPGAGELVSPNALLVGSGVPAALMGPWRLDSWGPPNQAVAMPPDEDKVLAFSSEGDFVWDRPTGDEEVWSGKMGVWQQHLAALNVVDLTRYRLTYQTSGDHLRIEQQTGRDAPLVFDFTREDPDEILSDEHVGLWTLSRYGGVMPAQSAVTWTQTLTVQRDGECRMDSDHTAPPWWRSGDLLLAGPGGGAALLCTRGASDPTWIGQAWSGSWGWGSTHQELVFTWADETAHQWEEYWTRTGDVPDQPVLKVVVKGPRKLFSGQASEYEVLCENTGQADAQDVTLYLGAPWPNSVQTAQAPSFLQIGHAPLLRAGKSFSAIGRVTVPAGLQQGFHKITGKATSTAPVQDEVAGSVDVTVSPPYLDIAVHEGGPPVARPGETVVWTVTLRNEGSDLELVVPDVLALREKVAITKVWQFDAGFSMQETPSFGEVLANAWTATWEDLVANIPNTGDQVVVSFKIKVSITAHPGETATNLIKLEPEVDVSTEDSDPADNSDSLETVVVTAYDPNAIYVTPQPIAGLAANQTVPGGRLHYAIEFENEGNIEAEHVHVISVLSPLLDFDTLELGAAPTDLPQGATYNVQVSPATRTIRWDFDALQLQPEESRFVHFSVSVNGAVSFAGQASAKAIQDAHITFENLPSIRTEPPAEVEIVKPLGDVDGNGMLELGDLRAFIREWRSASHAPYYPSVQAQQVTNGDLDLNGRLEARDASMLMERLRERGLLP